MCCSWPCRRAARGPSSGPRPSQCRPPGIPEAGSWARYERGAAFLESLASGGAPRAVWNALPGPEWSEELARAVAATLASGRGALVVLPDGRAVARVDAALTALLGEGRHAVLTADAGPEKRYREWLAVRRGAVRAVIGTRAAMFAPVRDLGLVAIWDDGDDSHSEQHAPQPHAREVLLLRAALDKCGFLLGSWSCTVEAAQLVESGWARPLVAVREQVRAAAPLVRTVGDQDLARDEAARAARLPTLAWQAVREGLRHGPVLVQVPRRGYVPRMACAGCRAPARCRHCCRADGGAGGGRRAAVRVVREGRERPGTVRSAAGSGCGRRSWGRGARPRNWGGRFRPCRCGPPGVSMCWTPCRTAPALVVSTPGAEPVAEGGYAAALLLDGWAMLGRPDLRAGEDALRRWIAACLAGPAAGRRRHRGRRRRADTAARAGAGALGSRRPCGAGARRAGRARLSAGVADGGVVRGAGRRSPSSCVRSNCPGRPRCWGPCRCRSR